MQVMQTGFATLVDSSLDLSNDMTKGTGNYPKTIVQTMRLLTVYVPPPRLQRMHNPYSEGLAFIQGDPGTPRGPKKNVKCFHCNGSHYKADCPELKLLELGIQNLNIDDCEEEHNLFSADEGYGLIQKQVKGV